MYTRRFSTPIGRAEGGFITPPPDYSGTAYRTVGGQVPENSERKEKNKADACAGGRLSDDVTQTFAHTPRLVPPPALSGGVLASALPEYARNTVTRAFDGDGALSGESATAADAAESRSECDGEQGNQQDAASEREKSGVSRRPDMDAPPTPRNVRFTSRTARGRGAVGGLFQAKRPMGIRQGEEGFHPRKRRGGAGKIALGKSGEWQYDDILLLGLLFLFLNGREETVRSHMDIIVILGFLFLMGSGEGEKDRMCEKKEGAENR